MSHTYQGHRTCSVCGNGPGHPAHLGTLPGMEPPSEELAQAIATAAEELAARMLEPIDINQASGRMERESPLFRFTGDNPGLF